MDIKLYTYSGMSNVVDKTLTLVSTSSSAKFLEPYDEYAPVIRYRGKTNFDDVNYIGIEESGTGGFTRYYFIDDVTYKTPNIALIRCHLDVLKTYSSYISGLTCYIERTADPTFITEAAMDTRPLSTLKNIEKKTFRDVNDNVEGFVVPGETKDHQKDNGMYVLSVLTAGYGPAEVTP